MSEDLYADNPEDLNIGIVLQYHINWEGKIDSDTLIKKARNNGFRGVSVRNATKEQITSLQKACEKYSIKFCQSRPALRLYDADDITKIIIARFEKRNAYFEVDLTKEGHLTSEDSDLLLHLRNWLDSFGHAFYEARPEKNITSNPHAYIFKNAIAPYQIYIFIHQPLPETITLVGMPEIKRAMWIDSRTEIDFNQNKDQVTLELKRNDEDKKFNIYGIRFEAHRPEDDLGPTKY
ncbi:hypothetical protein FP435_00650 [Lactobacillus sp. PV037]|uniref:hypothetical protein n=1 Tax=unclassified Lactobacillus TaxID=2620435 RepID=UPI00223F295F|nr:MULTISPECIES: hypothetical protein [unclassified Lactobacillus]QNQ82826.1 hypothetical protein FP433_07165 [Lactobacillus sp. PV012]QNQ83051.1 hypothetical protein FP435_00650 [Lactobacillus sp. PV037]